MKRIFPLLFMGMTLAAGQMVQAQTQIDAFPGAEGAGRYTTGGRGGKVIHVTKLDDDGSVGTLRYALEKVSGKRTVVFDVAGTITLTKRMVVKYGDVTIAGQTAPGDGICLKKYGFQVKASNVIVRFLRFRLGDEDNTQEEDAMGGFTSDNSLSDVIVDHCTASWSVDECASYYGIKNLSIQWCYIYESMYDSNHPKGKHGYAGIWGGAPASFHHNLIAHHTSRNPRLCGSRFSNDAASEMVDIRNNVFYNWGPTNSGYAGEGGVYNFVGNYYKPGPTTATKPTLCYRIFQANADAGDYAQAAGVWGTFHLRGNQFDTQCLSGSSKTNAEAVNSDNWKGLHLNGSPAGGKTAIESQVEFKRGEATNITTHTAKQACENVLAYGGCSLVRDVHDTRVSNEVKNGTYTYVGSRSGMKGIIDSQNDVGGYPVLTATDAQISALKDSDNDGIPDNMEDVLFGGDVNGAAVYKDGYTYLEYYLNYLVRNITKGELAGDLEDPDAENPNPGGGDDPQPVVNEAFMASGEAGNYSYFWFNEENRDQVQAWLDNGTIILNDGCSFKPADQPKNSDGSLVSPMTGYIQVAKSTGEITFKCPGVSTFKLYLFRTGSFAGDVSVSADGTNFTSVAQLSSSKGVYEPDFSAEVLSDAPVYVKVTNASTGSLSVQGALIMAPSSTGLNAVAMNQRYTYHNGVITAPCASQIRIYDMQGAVVTHAQGTQLSVAHLPHGMYAVRFLMNDGHMVVKKIIR